MGTWKRCPKTFFYLKTTRDARIDKRAESFDRAYVDPIDFILVRSMPWRLSEPDQRGIAVIRWMVRNFEAGERGGDLDEDESRVLGEWAWKIVTRLGGGVKFDRVQKHAMLADLDVDAFERDRLLDAIEHLVIVAPPEDMTMDQYKVPPTREALAGLLFTFGIASC